MGWGRARRKEADKEVRSTAVKPDSSAETARLFRGRSDPSAAVSPDNLIAGVTRTCLAKKRGGPRVELGFTAFPELPSLAWLQGKPQRGTQSAFGSPPGLPRTWGTKGEGNGERGKVRALKRKNLQRVRKQAPSACLASPARRFPRAGQGRDRHGRCANPADKGAATIQRLRLFPDKGP